MRTGFNRVVFGDGGKVFPVNGTDRLNAQLDEKPDAVMVFNPMDFSISFRIEYSGDGVTYGGAVNTTVTAGGIAMVAVNAGGPNAKFSVQTAGALAYFSFANFAKGNGLA